MIIESDISFTWLFNTETDHGSVAGSQPALSWRSIVTVSLWLKGEEM